MHSERRNQVRLLNTVCEAANVLLQKEEFITLHDTTYCHFQYILFRAVHIPDDFNNSQKHKNEQA